jgi:hypothetical protein
MQVAEKQTKRLLHIDHALYARAGSRKGHSFGFASTATYVHHNIVTNEAL